MIKKHGISFFLQTQYSSIVSFFIIYLIVFFNQLGNLFHSWISYCLSVLLIAMIATFCLKMIGKMIHFKNKENKKLVSIIQFILFVCIFTIIAAISVLDMNYHIDYLSVTFVFQFLLACVLGFVFFILDAISTLFFKDKV